MKTAKLRRLILEADGDLPEEVLRQVERSPELSVLHERTRAVRNLVALKNHEHPPAGFDTRMRQDIMRRIRQVESESSGHIAGWWQVLTAPTGPGLRFAAVAAVLAVVMLHGLTTLETRVSEATWATPEVVAAESPAPAVLGPVMLAYTNQPQYDLERLIRVFPTGQENVAPGQIQYGPVPSVPVSY